MSLWYTNLLVQKMSGEERKKAELLAEALTQILNAETDDVNLNYYSQVIEGNETVPVIVADSKDNILFVRNLDSAKFDNPKYLQRKLKKMKETSAPFVIPLPENETQYLYFSRSLILNQLTYYPYIQLGIILLFIMVAYFAFSSSTKAEQNQVWVGLTKETAHQLGTPISSLMAWLEMMKLRKGDAEMLNELEKDIARLEKITERFSKIGSKPILSEGNVINHIRSTVDYLKTRSSDNINFKLVFASEEVIAPINAALFEWVIENLCKNAMDAISSKGEIAVSVTDYTGLVHIDIADSGKGISKSLYKTIFKPGYTTKKKGWGLGLSLAKRIIEDYHNGKVFVYQSELNKGTVFRIVLRK
jgi:signal transduction histidine kinase